jgi:hypothetical protein
MTAGHWRTLARTRAAVAAAVALVLVTRPAASWGAAPGEIVVGLSPVYSYVVLQNGSQPKGGGGSLFLHYGLTSALALRLAGSWTGHQIEQTEGNPGGQYQVTTAALGIQYSLDLVSLNPSIEGGLGIMVQQLGKETTTDLEYQLGLAVDYVVLPWISVGAALHYHAFLTDPGRYPIYLDVGPRVALRWL